MPNKLWEPILKHQPDIFIWGGDIVYSDTEDMKLMKQNYELMKADSGYSSFREKIEVMGTWDDHDYGLNDGGASYIKKDSVQQIFLDFFDVPAHDPRRARKGIYTSKTFDVNGSSIKIIILDTRYFRSDLTVDPSGQRRYIPVENPGDTMLGTAQWKWLEEELMTSSSQFNIIVSSIQFLSSEHGFETWGNMPLEVEKMKDIIVKSKAKGVIFLSGDRHLAEISKLEVEGLDYPLIDFTSSGMTHSYSTYSGEPNSLRISDVIADKNFGLLYVDVNNNTVTMEIRGEDDQLFQRIIQKY
jgi:alkaline phosphatase D